MNSLPTVLECKTSILEQCDIILYSIEQKDDIDIDSLIESVVDTTHLFINALDISKLERTGFLKTLSTHSDPKDYVEIKLLIFAIKDICYQIVDYKPRISLSVPTHDFKKEIEYVYSKINDEDIWPDQIEKKAYWFRKYFVGKPYITLMGPFMDDLAIFSIIKESVTKHQSHIRIIVRTKQDSNMSFIVNEKDANEFILQLEFLNQTQRLDIEEKRTLRAFSFTGLSYSTKIMRAALLFLFQDINFKQFKEFSAETTIMLGLEKEFLKYDEIGIPKSYKFGLLTVKPGQTTEEEWFSNNDLSDALNRFLNIMAKPIKLKDYKGYAAGLDTKTGESGEISFISSWKDHEIMFHVGPLMPSRDNDLQQVHRKRHIGNDIVCIIFMEGAKEKFNPDSIRSQFLHVFIVVYYEIIDLQETWRIEVLHDKRVKPFSPPIPSPPLFYNEKDLREFLILKLINAENSSLKSEKFSIPNTKARLFILESLIQTGLEANPRQFFESREKKYHFTERPKSAGAHHIRNITFKIDTPRPVTPELPPIPSRSSAIKTLTRRKSNGAADKPVLFKEDDDTKLNSPDCFIENTSQLTFSNPSGIRYKAQNLVSSMIGRRNSRSRTVSSS